jgi:hypothetical protein
VESRPPAVPLEAGIGPENPPCPACGEPMFGWARTPSSKPVLRCEACGLGVVGDPGDEAAAMRALEGLRVDAGDRLRYRIANRASLAASLGTSGWDSIEAGSAYFFTPEAVRRLVSGRGQVLARRRWVAGASIASMWGTLMNSFTWGRNIAIGWLGKATAEPAALGWQRGMDRVISVLATPLVLLAAVLLEAGAALAGRGAVLELTLSLE